MWGLRPNKCKAVLLLTAVSSLYFFFFPGALKGLERAMIASSRSSRSVRRQRREAVGGFEHKNDAAADFEECDRT